MMTHNEERKRRTGLPSIECHVVWSRETLEKIAELKEIHPKSMYTKKEVPRGSKCEGTSQIFSEKKS